MIFGIGIASTGAQAAPELDFYVPGESREITDPGHYVYFETRDSKGARVYGRIVKVPFAFSVGKNSYLFNGMWMLVCGEDSGFGEKVKCDNPLPFKPVPEAAVRAAAQLEILRKRVQVLQDFEARTLKNYWITDSRADLDGVLRQFRSATRFVPMLPPQSKDPVEKLVLQVARKMALGKNWKNLDVEGRLDLLDRAKIAVEAEFHEILMGGPGNFMNAGFYLAMEKPLLLESARRAARELPAKIGDTYLDGLAKQYRAILSKIR